MSHPRSAKVLALAALFYLPLGGAALLWGLLAGRPHVFWIPGRSSWQSAWIGVAVGGAFGLLVVLATSLALRRGWGAKLYFWFAEVLGPVGWREALVLATLSAAGEEAFFRGAMQPALGLWLTSLVFALLHFAPRLDLAHWTLSAGAIGVVLGLLAERTGNLAGPIAAHFLINALNLARIGRYAALPEKLPHRSATPSMACDDPGGEESGRDGRADGVDHSDSGVASDR